jgi:hypothetical protein
LPGTVDVIVSDWELSHAPDEHGDRILDWVRRRDWDVPFVLISGKLGDAGSRAEVLQRLLENGSAGFVTRGDGGISKACSLAEDLIERRDLSLLKTILALRPGALADESIPATSGTIRARKMLEDLVSDPRQSHNVSRPIAAAHSEHLTSQDR